MCATMRSVPSSPFAARQTTTSLWPANRTGPEWRLEIEVGYARLALDGGSTIHYADGRSGRMELTVRLQEGSTDHPDINNVMLATSLVPEGFFRRRIEPT